MKEKLTIFSYICKTSQDAMNCANDLLKFLCAWVLEHCSEDLAFISKRVDNTIVDRLQSLASGSFDKISYAEAINVLKKVTATKHYCFYHLYNFYSLEQMNIVDVLQNFA